MTRNKPIIAVDAMGGDFGPSVVVAGSVDAARKEGLQVILVGDEERLEKELKAQDLDGISVKVHHAPQVVDMEDKPGEVLRRKKDSSIAVACQLVNEGKAHGVVSAGNSGATVACGMFILGRINGVERPGLASILFTEKLPMVLIDVGANVDSKPHHLFQFGLMAQVFAKDILGLSDPRVGLLSIGEEEGKGNTLTKEAFDLFKMASMNFQGNVEGRDIFSGDVDVVVCDGFVGNVALKLSEGLGTSLVRLFKTELKRGLANKLGVALAQSAIRRFAALVDYAEYGGAPLLGLKNIVIVCHGSSNSKAITNAVRLAGKYVETKANDHLIEELVANEEFTRFGKAVKS